MTLRAAGYALALICALAAPMAALAQSSAGESDPMNKIVAASNAYGTCMLDGLRSGTKIDLAEPVVTAAIDHCEATYNSLLAVLERDLPLQRRAAMMDMERRTHANPGMRRARAVWSALSTYYDLNAGGQPAAGTARSK